MSVSSANAAAASKTRYVETLTSGTSYTVPAGVEYVNATLIGGGGSGRSSANAGDYTGYQQPYGAGGQIITTTVTTTPGASIAYAIGAGGAGRTSVTGGDGNAGGSTTFTGATTATGGAGGTQPGVPGTTGLSANNGGGGGILSPNSGTGGAGQIILEYWK